MPQAVTAKLIESPLDEGRLAAEAETGPRIDNGHRSV
jgi:hypothetical protein